MFVRCMTSVDGRSQPRSSDMNDSDHLDSPGAYAACTAAFCAVPQRQDIISEMTRFLRQIVGCQALPRLTAFENPSQTVVRRIEYHARASHPSRSHLSAIPGESLSARIRQRRPWLLSVSAGPGSAVNTFCGGSNSALARSRLIRRRAVIYCCRPSENTASRIKCAKNTRHQ